MVDLDTCGNCGEEAAVDSEYCPHCGVLFENAADATCESDRDREATAVCIICRRFICERCGVQVGNRWLCKEHANVEVVEDWAKVYDSADPVLVSAMKAALEASGLEVIDQNWKARGGRSGKLFVPVPDYLRAVEVLKAES